MSLKDEIVAWGKAHPDVVCIPGSCESCLLAKFYGAKHVSEYTIIGADSYERDTTREEARIIRWFDLDYYTDNSDTYHADVIVKALAEAEVAE